MSSHSSSSSPLAHHFDSLEQQKEVATLGMWAFLITEVMFFGGLFATYTLYRILYPEAMAEASADLDVTLGAINTAVLICSSLTMALAVHAAQTNKRKQTVAFLVSTIVLGAVFLGIKAVEYAHKFEVGHVPGSSFVWEGPNAGGAQIFYSLYFGMTGIHALHMIVGIGIMLVIIRMAAKGRFSEKYYSPVEMTGLYWHFVDIVWIFLFPLLYLLGRH